jgi:spermidine synthase
MSHRQRGRGGPVIRQDVASGVAELVRDAERPRAWTLLVDGAPQSHVDLDDPRRLEFEYMRLLGHVIDLAGPAGAPLRVAHLGAGGLTLARYVATTRPGSGQLAVESDAELAELVRRSLPLDQRGRRSAGGQPGRVRVRIGDARLVIEIVPAASFDVVVADLFADARTPGHLTSAEFTEAVARALAPSGVYAVNVTDGPPLAHARARVATVRSVFPQVCVLADPAVLRERRFGNLVVVAAQQGLPLPELARRAAAGPATARLIQGADLDRFLAGARPITDDRAAGSQAPPPDAFADRR